MSQGRELDDAMLLPDLFGKKRWGRLVKSLGLPPRQAEVARLTCRGCEDKEIARRLGIKPNSVRLHMKKLFERLKISRRIGILVRLVMIDRGQTTRRR